VQQEQKESGTIEINKATLWMIIAGVFFLALIASIFTQGFGIKDNQVTGVAVAPSLNPGAAPSGIPTGIANVDAAELVDDDPVLGKKDAPLTIVEFSDFQCPFCARFREQTLDQLKKEYIDTGKVRFVYRDFPLSSIHPYAEKAAEAAECADEQGKYWEYHDKLFENQQALDVVSLKKYAAELKLDAGKFADCLDSGKYEDEVAKDLADGSKVGITGTPGFIIGKRSLSGAQPFSNFKAAIDAELVG